MQNTINVKSVNQFLVNVVQNPAGQKDMWLTNYECYNKQIIIEAQMREHYL